MTPRERVAVRLAAALLLAVAAATRGLPAMQQWHRATEERAEQHRRRLAQLHADIDRLPVLEDSAAALARALAGLAPSLLSGHDPTEAGADLAARARSTLEGSGARLLGARVIDSGTATERLRESIVRLELEGDGRALLAGVAALESAPTVLEMLDVQLAVADPGDGNPELVRAALAVRGWFLGDSGRRSP